ncbi:uncharacterized protein EI90DRAFT_3120483 [Cantharellus anzutake]|uniref:uncharacterized protein n=1 Tax=Cantharellus anzutake TaxID=1750568 RepID=UPI001903B6F1|nr:uncharacterized protein EI90DRAFT_3120483 [Cantharellus anzutake]KAF8335398.1 hypothetical protein EI90DRAFT_3120483 [Cantharellus anzutake]
MHGRDSDLHARYFELKFEDRRNPSVDDFDKRYGYVQRTPKIPNEAGMKYILLSLWRHHPSNEARACRVANMTAFKFSEISTHASTKDVGFSLSQLMDGNYGHLPAAVCPPTPLPIPDKDEDMKSDGKATTGSVDEAAPLPERRFPTVIWSETEAAVAGPSDLSNAAISATAGPSSKKV